MLAELRRANHGCGERFAQRGRRHLALPPTVMARLAGGVDRERHAVVGDPHVETRLRSRRGGRASGGDCGAHALGDGVGVVEAALLAHHAHVDAGIGEPRVPLNTAQRGLERRKVTRHEAGDSHPDVLRDSQPGHRAPQRFEIGIELDAAGADVRRDVQVRAHLVGSDGFESGRDGGEGAVGGAHEGTLGFTAMRRPL